MSVDIDLISLFESKKLPLEMMKILSPLPDGTKYQTARVIIREGMPARQAAIFVDYLLRYPHNDYLFLSYEYPRSEDAFVLALEKIAHEIPKRKHTTREQMRQKSLDINANCLKLLDQMKSIPLEDIDRHSLAMITDAASGLITFLPVFRNKALAILGRKQLPLEPGK